MLVHHLRLAPVQAPASGHHGFGQVMHLVTVHFATVGGQHKGRQLDLGIVALRNVTHDGMEILTSEALAADLSKQRLHGSGRLGWVYKRGMAIDHAQLCKRIFGQADLATADDAVVVHHIERGHHMAPIGAYLHFGQRLESLRPVNLAVPVQVGDVFAVGVNGNPAQGQV